MRGSFKANKKLFSTSLLRRAKEPPQNLETFKLVNRAQLLHNSSKDSAFNAFRYFTSLRESNSPLLSDTYTQLPDDTQFITKHYQKLVNYRDLICGHGGRFDSLGSVEELFKKLSELNPLNKKANSVLVEEEIKIFDGFIEDLVTLFKRNGGHLFILDLGIYNMEVFSHFEKVGHCT